MRVLLRRVVRLLMRPRSRRAQGGCATVVLTGFVLLGLGLTGPDDLSKYPDPKTSPYLLPWAGGETHLCVQGNRGVVSHHDKGQYAYDFAMKVGTVITAARAGTVVKVVQNHDGQGRSAPNNLVVVKHDDGTHGHYLHIKKGGSLVVKGQSVKQGQPVAFSGNVGKSLLPHLHFHVTDAKWRMIPMVFHDVKTDRGIPRMFKRYTSGNRALGEVNGNGAAR